MIKRPEQRVAVFIDTQNMYHSAKHLYGARLHFGKLVEEIVDGRNLVRAFAYVARSKNGDEKAFLGALESAGIELRIKDVIEFSSGERKADWDVGMTIDAVKFADRVDAVVLVTGDGDFVPLVEYLKGKGIIVEAAAFAESTSHSLKEAVDHYFDISEHRGLLIRPGLFRGFGMKKQATATDEGYDLSLTDEPLTEEREQEEARERTRKSPKQKPRASTGGKQRTVRITT
jgi:uncharacterized LabA/DUF88 family protein